MREYLAAAFSSIALAYAAVASAAPPPTQPAMSAAPVKIVSDWPSHLGPSGAFADTSGVKLIDDISKVKLVWQSEETGIGFGKAFSHAATAGFAGGTGLPPSGAASPILAGGLVIQSYPFFLPRGPVIGQDVQKGLGAKFEQFKNFTYVSADDVVIAIDAATGKTRWKQVFEDKGLNYLPSKRNEWNVTPCAAGGRVFAFGTTGRLYGLDLATGKVLWESNIGPLHQQIEAMKKEGLESRQMVTKGTYKPYGMLITLDDILLAPDWAGGLLGIDLRSGRLPHLPWWAISIHLSRSTRPSQRGRSDASAPTPAPQCRRC